MSREIERNKKELIEKYKEIDKFFSNPLELSLHIEKYEAKKPLIQGAWAWDVVTKYFPLADRHNWKKKWAIVKKAVKLCQERGVNVGIVSMYGEASKEEKEWLKNGFWWRVQKFPRLGRLTKTDAKMLQEHRYNVIRGIANGGQKILKSVGYKDEEAKQIFFRGMTEELVKKNLLPSGVRLKITNKGEEK